MRLRVPQCRRDQGHDLDWLLVILGSVDEYVRASRIHSTFWFHSGQQGDSFLLGVLVDFFLVVHCEEQ